MADTATDAAPAPAPAAEAPAAPPAVQGPAPGQRSTGGDLSNGKPAPRAITRESAGDILRQAYGRQKEMQDGATNDGEQTPPSQTPGESGQPSTRPADAPENRGRGPDGRFLPRQAAAVDAPPRPAVERAPTQAPPRPAAPAKAPAPAPATAPAEQPAPPGGPAPDAPPSSAAPDEAGRAASSAPPQGDQGLPDEFRSARWQRAFQAEPGLRRTVGRIRANPALTEAQRTTQIAEKLRDGEQAADAADWREQQMRQLRDNNPQAYIAQLKADEAEAEASSQLALRITQMIAEAYEVDPTDPDFLEAGPREGDDRVEGLRRFVEYTSSKSPVVRGAVQTALEAQAGEHQKAVEALKAQHKLDVEAALERGRSQARSPYGRNGAPPRSTGTGVVPVGQDEGPGGGPRAPAKAPTVAGIRDLIGMGYQQREPA